jgi:hypothetical protein
MPEEMVLALERVDPHPEAKRAFAAHGINGYWRKSLDLAAKQPPTFSWYNTTAELNTRLGENDTAIKRLNGAFAARDHLMTQLKVNPVFDPLRSDPRFAELMARMNLKP